MNVEFVRFNATDDVQLQGWLTNVAGETAVLHMHGRSGNGYENYFLDNLRETFAAQAISFYAIDNRGRGIISDFRKGDGWKLAGSCYEIFDESAHDIAGALDYLRSIGKTRFILQGHSLGCTKVVNYIMTQNAADVEKVILLAPTDMVGWAKTDANHETYFAKAKELLAQNLGEELVASQCWPDKVPISAQAYASVCEAGSSADIYGEREGAPLLGRVQQPMLIVYGDDDIGITQIDGTIENWQARVAAIKHAESQVAIIPDATHGFRNYEAQLAHTIQTFIATS